MEDRRHIFNRPITLLVFMVSVKNQNPLYAVVRNRIVGKVVIYKALHKGDVNKKVRIAEPLRNEDCSTANLRTRQTGWYSVTKPLFAQWTKNVKCNIRICFHLWQSVNENKCITAAWIQP